MTENINQSIVKPPTNKRAYIFVVVCAMQILVWTDEFTFATLTPFWSEHFGFDAVQIGSISSAYLLGYFPMLLVGGILADIVGSKRMLILAAIGCGILSLSMIFMEGYDMMYWRNLIFGVFFGFNWAPCNKMMADWFPGHERGARASLWGTLSTASQIFVAPFSLLIASTLGWKYAFIMVTILAVPVIIMLLFTTNKPADMKNISPEEVAYINAGRDEEALKNEKINFKSLGICFRDWNVWVVIFAIMLATGPTWIAASWGSMTLMAGFGLSPEGAASLIAPMSIIPVVFSLFTGLFLRKLFKGNIKGLLIGAPILGSACYLSVAFIEFTPFIAAFLIYGLAYCTNAWGWGASNLYWAAYAKPELWGTLNGIAPFFQVAFGYTLVAISGRWVSETATMGGYGDLYLYAGLIWLVGIVFGLIAKKRTIVDTWETSHKK